MEKIKNHITWYKWLVNDDIFCARVVMETTACYYKNGELYAEYQPWIVRDTDISISEEEFDILIDKL